MRPTPSTNSPSNRGAWRRMPRRTRRKSAPSSRALRPKCMAAWVSPIFSACTIGSSASASTARRWAARRKPVTTRPWRKAGWVTRSPHPALLAPRRPLPQAGEVGITSTSQVKRERSEMRRISGVRDSLTPPSHTDGLPFPQRIWAVATIALGVIMAVMDSAIANVALPTIGIDLNTDPALSIWIVNGYQLAVTISLLPLAALGDIIGYRRVYLAGLILFTIASLLCALSHSLPMLAFARVVQGFGRAGIMSVNSALIRFIYPQSMLGRGLSINVLVVAISAAAGPSVAAAILF